jgi:fibronectin type 3 domain-containing protein
LLTWTAATNTTATNVSLAFIGDKARMFRLSASNALPQSATLAWDPSPGTDVITNYNLYYGAASATYTNKVAAGTNTTASISNLVDGTTYFFAATAVDTNGLESGYSTEVSAPIAMRLRIQRLP